MVKCCKEKKGQIHQAKWEKEISSNPLCLFQRQKTYSALSSQVTNQITHLKKQHHDAIDFLRTTSEGLDTINRKMSINSIRNKILMLCPSFDKIDAFMGDKASTNLHLQVIPHMEWMERTFFLDSLNRHKHLHKLHLILQLKSGMIHLTMRRMHLTLMKMLLVMRRFVTHKPHFCVQKTTSNHI